MIIIIGLGALIVNVLIGTVVLIVGCLILDKIQQWSKDSESKNQDKAQ